MTITNPNEILDLGFFDENKHATMESKMVTAGMYDVEVQIFGTIENPLPVYVVTPKLQESFSHYRFNGNFVFSHEGKLLVDVEVHSLVTSGRIHKVKPISSVFADEFDAFSGERGYLLLTYIYKHIAENAAVQEAVESLLRDNSQKQKVN